MPLMQLINTSKNGRLSALFDWKTTLMVASGEASGNSKRGILQSKKSMGKSLTCDLSRTHEDGWDVRGECFSTGLMCTGMELTAQDGDEILNNSKD